MPSTRFPTVRHGLRLCSCLCLCLLLGPLLFGTASSALAKDPAVEEEAKKIKKFATDAFEQDQRERALRKLAEIGSAEAAAVVAEALRDPFLHLRDHAVSAWITMLRGEKAAEVRTWIEKRGLRHKDPAVRAGLLTALGVVGEEAAPLFKAALAKEKKAEVLCAAFKAMLRLAPDAPLQGLFAKHMKSKDPDVCYWCAQACARYDGKEAEPALLRMLDDKRPKARVGALFGLNARGALDETLTGKLAGHEDAMLRTGLALAAGSTEGSLSGERGAALLQRLADDNSWRVRSAVVQSLLRRWTPASIDVLIERLAVERGRLRGDVHRALGTITGKDLPLDPDQWKAWWQTKRDDFALPESPKALPDGRIPFRTADEGIDAGATVSFVDLPIQSKRLVFLFDLSGSMRNPLERGKTETKMAWLRRQFEAAVDALPEDVHFDLWVYRYPSTYPPKPVLTRAFGKLEPATRRSVKKAKGWLKKQEPKGWGAFYEPMTDAFLEDVDTIILLSDGAPSRGLLDRDFRILQEYPTANALHQVAIDTVFIGTKKKGRTFMQDLSRATGGRFKDVLSK